MGEKFQSLSFLLAICIYRAQEVQTIPIMGSGCRVGGGGQIDRFSSMLCDDLDGWGGDGEVQEEGDVCIHIHS